MSKSSRPKPEKPWEQTPATEETLEAEGKAKAERSAALNDAYTEALVCLVVTAAFTAAVLGVYAFKDSQGDQFGLIMGWLTLIIIQAYGAGYTVGSIWRARALDRTPLGQEVARPGGRAELANFAGVMLVGVVNVAALRAMEAFSWVSPLPVGVDRTVNLVGQFLVLLFVGGYACSSQYPDPPPKAPDS